MPRITVTCSSLIRDPRLRNSVITAGVIIIFTALLSVPKGYAQYNTYGYPLSPYPYPYSLIFSPDRIAYPLPLLPLIPGQTSSRGVRYSQQNSTLQSVDSSASTPLSTGMYGLYYFPQGALGLSRANGLFLSQTPDLSFFSSLTNNSLANALSSFLSSPALSPASAFSVANSSNFTLNPLLQGLGIQASLFTGLQGFQPRATQPLAALHGSLITWPRAEQVVPAISPVAPISYTYTVVNAYLHDRLAFTQGLVFNNGFLYEGTGVPGRSQVRRVDLLTGSILQSADLPSPYWGEGITIYGTKLIQLTWLHNTGFVYDQFTFAQLQSFSYPTEGWGITHDGKNLIMSDGTATLHFLDPVTFAQVSSIDVYDQNGPVSRLNELEYIKGEIYANVWLTDRIVRISPATGQVVGWIDLTGLLTPADLVYPVDVLNGIAYDAKNDRLFVTGKYWPKLFEITLIPLP